ncbi:MAG: zinc metallopeptidase [Anaerorhabdus sp.]
MTTLVYIVLVTISGLFATWASSRVSSTYKKYSTDLSSRGIKAEDACRQVLDAHGLHSVQIDRVSGQLTDHYSPKENIIRLSDAVYGQTSSAAIGVACHEAGHAMQYADGYAPIKLRNAIIPITNLGSTISMPLILAGIALSVSSSQWIGLAYIGVILFSTVSLFQLFTLPTEFNASSRALKVIQDNDILTSEELVGSRAVLSAAALTYVAALASSLVQLLRLVLLVLQSRKRN